VEGNATGGCTAVGTVAARGAWGASADSPQPVPEINCAGVVATTLPATDITTSTATLNGTLLSRRGRKLMRHHRRLHIEVSTATNGPGTSVLLVHSWSVERLSG